MSVFILRVKVTAFNVVDNEIGQLRDNDVDLNLNRITADQLQRRLATHPALIDVRSAEDFRDGHVAGSINVPLETVNHSFQITDMSPQSLVILICADARKADVAADALRERGFSNTAVLAGGLKSWIAFGYPLLKTES